MEQRGRVDYKDHMKIHEGQGTSEMDYDISDSMWSTQVLPELFSVTGLCWVLVVGHMTVSLMVFTPLVTGALMSWCLLAGVRCLQATGYSQNFHWILSKDYISKRRNDWTGNKALRWVLAFLVCLFKHLVMKKKKCFILYQQPVSFLHGMWLVPGEWLKESEEASDREWREAALLALRVTGPSRTGG